MLIFPRFQNKMQISWPVYSLNPLKNLRPSNNHNQSYCKLELRIKQCRRNEIKSPDYYAKMRIYIILLTLSKGREREKKEDIEKIKQTTTNNLIKTHFILRRDRN